MTKAEYFLKRNQEQATAAWINYLNGIRIDGLLTTLRQQDANLEAAMASIKEAVRTIDIEIVARDRGHVKGMHGFIAEVAEVGVGNARELILGKEAINTLINNNGPVDFTRGAVDIQQKFYAGRGHFSLDAVAKHLERYPDFVKNGGKYQIPKDQFEIIQKLQAMPEKDAYKYLSRSGDGLSLKDWTKARNFFNNQSLTIDSIEPSTLDYHAVQKGRYAESLSGEMQSLQDTDQSLRVKAFQENGPTLGEGTRVAVVASILEGSAAFVVEVAKKRREGKSLKNFSEDDWSDVIGETGIGFAKGGVRGASVYVLSNYTATSAATASSIVTAGFGIAEQANRFRRGEITELEFIENAEKVALEAAVSAASSLVGQALIPVPVLGALIGNTVGLVIFKSVSSALTSYEEELIANFLATQEELDTQLSESHQILIDSLNESMAAYLDLLERAFSPNIEIAFLGSIELAKEVGVSADDVLTTAEEVSEYFLR